ncbi:YihY/virulence factor BrkB family protein [Microbacterium sp. SLBN-146]|uniref:YihY/virulence factor BrkB family protein n=1 Tax=Microbacterium sp. SLBN-146 TaxID=2768457 RepID=UPI00115419E9|nr:YihY/virulence factor BrkB family protein [Microbacterium sp. SLBN-146]TQJ30747.1 membrane protein [Microbacterium sp. SLBN-146]
MDATEEAKATRPTQIRPQTWSYVVRRTIQEFISDHCADAAAGLTFFAVLSFFPAGLAIVAVVGIVGDSERVLERLLSLVDQVAPTPVVETIRGPLTEIAGASGAGLTLIVAIATAVWSASLYVGAFGRALNRIYGITEGRPYWKRKPAQLALTILLIVLATIVVGVVALSGPVARGIGDLFDIGETALLVWDVAKWPLLAAAVIAMTAVLYKGTSNLQQPRFRWLGLGAILAIVLLGVASAGFAFYVSAFASYNRTFGALAGVVIFLLWLFLVNLALLFGAEFNAELERGRQLQAGIRAEKHLQLPPRDTTASERVARSTRVTEERGALLRRGEDLPPRDDTMFAKAVQLLRDLWQRMTRRD